MTTNQNKELLQSNKNKNTKQATKKIENWTKAHTHFTEEETKRAHKHLKGRLVSFTVRESKTTVKHLPTSIEKCKTQTPPSVGGDVEPQELSW